jgi:hypothetical protein
VKRIYEVLEGVYSNDSLRRTIVPLFVGNPGIGKTVIIDKFAKDKGVKIVELITSQMSPFEISGIAYPDKDSKKMEYYNFDKLENLVDGDILFFDELLNGNPVVLNACLTILEQRRFISGKSLPNIMIVAAANPQGMAPLTPQIKERFVWYDVKFNSTMWSEYMFNKYGLVKPIASKLSTLIQNEKDFNGNNFHTPRSIDKAVNMIIKGLPTPYEPIVKPILETLIENKTGKTVTLGDGKEIAPNEQMSWLQLIRLKSNVKLLEESTSEKVVETNNYSIVMMDRDKNIIGEIKDAEILKSMYYFYDEDITRLENGEIITPHSPKRVPPRFFFFKKK